MNKDELINIAVAATVASVEAAYKDEYKPDENFQPKLSMIEFEKKYIEPAIKELLRLGSESPLK